MFDRVPNKEPLQTRLIRHAFAVKAAAAVMFFFAAAWSILQWTLATGPQFSASGLERDFVLIESALCLALAACAFAYLLASAIAWTLTLRALRKGAVPQPRRLPANRPQRRRLAAQG